MFPATKQCNYAYTHPTSKQCTGGDCSTLNGKSASQIIQEASSSASGWKPIYNQTHDISGWNDTNGSIRLMPFTVTQSIINSYTSISIALTYSIHYRTSSFTSQNNNNFELNVAGATDADSWLDERICVVYPAVANSDNTASGTAYFAGALSGYKDRYGIFTPDKRDNTSTDIIQTLCIKGYVSDGLISGSNLSGSTLKIEIKGR